MEFTLGLEVNHLRLNLKHKGKKSCKEWTEKKLTVKKRPFNYVVLNMSKPRDLKLSNTKNCKT